jgi:hypothetical protein
MSDPASITYVTAYYPYIDTPHFVSNSLAEMHHIHSLILSNAQVCMYIAPESAYRNVFFEWARVHDNFRIMSLRLPETYRKTKLFEMVGDTNALPASRNVNKDTIEHLIWTHYRAELLADVAKTNPFSSSHVVWLDSNLAKLFRTTDDAFDTTISDQLFRAYRQIANHIGCTETNAVFLPGCTSKPLSAQEADKAMNGGVCWRFCGCVVAGEIRAVAAFASEYLSRLYAKTEESRRITWDVNFLAYLETTRLENSDESLNQGFNQGWTPVWYHADHNESLIRFADGLPFTFVATSLTKSLNTTETSVTKYEYPIIDSYYPGSTSFVRWNGTPIINTRYTNYFLTDRGYYIFANSEHVIRNKNFAAILDPETMAPTGFHFMEHVMERGSEPGSCVIMKRPLGEDRKYVSFGIEDIRLFVGRDNTLMFIGTTVDYSPVHCNRMIIGEYDHVNGRHMNCRTVVPPDPESGCEKNWVPIFREGIDRTEQYIYKWWPLQIGEIDESTGQLRITQTVELRDPVFKKTRGSSTFCVCPDFRMNNNDDNTEYTTGEYLVGIVHFSEEGSPRKYYHFLTIMDKATLVPVARSDIFYFFEESIEFSIGFDVCCDNGNGNRDPYWSKCRFWVSRMDRDPVVLEMAWTVFSFHSVN